MILGKVMIALALAILAGGLIGYRLGGNQMTERAQEANRRALAAAGEAQAARAAADLALEEHRAAVVWADSLEQARERAEARLAAVRVRRVPLPEVVPDTCRVFAVEVDRLQEEVRTLEAIGRVDSVRIETLTQDNTRLARALSASQSALLGIEKELKEQSKRTETAPRKILGIIPVPDITFGYGLTSDGSRTMRGAQVGVGYRIKL
jgi:hypothetical protein